MAPSQPASATDLLAYAGAVLDGTISMPPRRATRAAAMLTRQALEDIVQAMCRSVGANLDRASMRSRLICLRILIGDEDADAAETGWAGLCRACHHHAYELTPTETEVRHLVDVVGSLCERWSRHGGSSGTAPSTDSQGPRPVLRMVHAGTGGVERSTSATAAP